MARETHEDKIKRLSRLVVTLSNEIDYKNHRLLEMEFEKNDASASLLSLTASLTARLDKRDRQLVEMEHTHKLLSEEVSRFSEEKERMLDKGITDLGKLDCLRYENAKLKHDMIYHWEIHERQLKAMDDIRAQVDLKQKNMMREKEDLSELHQLMIEAVRILNIEAPDLYVRQSPVPNAYTLAVNGKKPFVVVHTSLVELLTWKELQRSVALSGKKATIRFAELKRRRYWYPLMILLSPNSHLHNSLGILSLVGLVGLDDGESVLEMVSCMFGI